MRRIRYALLGGLLTVSAFGSLRAQEAIPELPPSAGFPGSYADPTGVPAVGIPGMAAPTRPLKPKLIRRSVTEEILVPVSPEELAEVQEYQAALTALRADDRTPEQKAAAKEALGKLVEKQFDRDLETREKEVAELEARTKKLRQQFDKRKAAKAEIIALRLQTLQNEIDGLGFPSTEGIGAVTAPGSTGWHARVGVPAPYNSTHDAPAFQPLGELPATDPLETPIERFEPLNPKPATEKPLPKPNQPGANLLQNPSFEDGPNSWGTGGTPETVEYTVSDKGGVNETQAARIRKTANKYFPIAEWTQRIEYDGKSPAIEVSAQVKTQEARKAVLDVLFLDEKDEWIKHEWAAYIGDQSDDPQPLTHDFKEYKGTVAIPPNTKTIVIGLQDYGPGDVWFDDVQAVYRSELPKEPNNVP